MQELPIEEDEVPTSEEDVHHGKLTTVNEMCV